MDRFRLMSDVSPADWVVTGVGPFGTGVRSLLPRGFEAYARILHPAVSADGIPVRWDSVAELSSRTMHSLAEFQAIAHAQSGGVPQPRPFATPPRDGHLTEPILAALTDILAGHTSTTETCWFCLWEGYGWVPRATPPERVRLPARDYFLFEGRLDAASDVGWWDDGRLVDAQSPNLFWPADWAWFVATEIDLDSTFVGGSTALIDDLLGDGRLEAWPAQLTAPVSASSDVINRP